MKLNSKNKKLIGIWGYPAPDILEEIKTKYPENRIIDLDINYNVPSSGILPNAYCKIMKNIIDNSIAFRENLDVIIASAGREKCDSGWFAAQILKDMGFEVIATKYEKYGDKRLITPISRSTLPLKEKIITIMDNVIQKQDLFLTESKPEFGFWGVPPNDLDFLDIFPDNTHVYGWTKCVEAGSPADIDLEMYVDENIPTVFFTQTFCAKMQLAKYLAKKHRGICIDVDDTASNSVKAKIEAFIKLG